MKCVTFILFARFKSTHVPIQTIRKGGLSWGKQEKQERNKKKTLKTSEAEERVRLKQKSNVKK